MRQSTIFDTLLPLGSCIVQGCVWQQHTLPNTSSGFGACGNGGADSGQVGVVRSSMFWQSRLLMFLNPPSHHSRSQGWNCPFHVPALRSSCPVCFRDLEATARAMQIPGRYSQVQHVLVAQAVHVAKPPLPLYSASRRHSGLHVQYV